MQYKSHPNTLKRQNREVAVLLSLSVLYGLYRNFIGTEVSAILIGVLISLAILKPEFFNPFRWFWFKLATILGAISSRLILSLAYFFVLFPVGLIKRTSLKKHFQFDNFKKSDESVLIVNNKEQAFSKDDILHPY